MDFLCKTGELLVEYRHFYLEGAWTTLQLAFFTVILGFALGVLLALMRLSNIWPLKTFAVAYIEFIRGTPLLVQLFIIYFGLPQFGVDLPDFTAGVVTLSLNSAAYLAEIFRTGIQAVDKGQMEAARSLGMPHGMAMRHIILPQAIRNILPAIGNEFVVIIKEPAVVMIIGIPDLMYNTDTVRSNTFMPFTPLLIGACVYFILTFTMSKLVGAVERRLKVGD